MDVATKSLEFITTAKSVFHAVEELKNKCLKEGFILLSEGEKWHLEKGKKYVVIRNMSSILAFTIGEEMKELAFNITASHSDSPTFKLKNADEIEGAHALKLACEGYGGMILSTWLDRPLSVAGRVAIRSEKGIEMRLFDAKKNICIIPNQPIHMNRELNAGYKYQMHIDLVPLLADKRSKKGAFKEYIANDLQVKVEDILGVDLYLVNNTPAGVIGLNDEFIASAKLDNLLCAYATLTAFLASENKQRVNLYACFDNEEVGSLTRQGADSTFMEDVMDRIAAGLNYSEEDLQIALHHSMMLSVDNAHAKHPNHPELFDNEHGCFMNEGVVIKQNASQRYTSDAVSIAYFEEMCQKANVPTQHYFNRSDKPGGSTLGNLAMHHVNVKSVDIGLAQLAMHSSYECAGKDDVSYLIQACLAFYDSNLRDKDSRIEY